MRNDITVALFWAFLKDHPEHWLVEFLRSLAGAIEVDQIAPPDLLPLFAEATCKLLAAPR